MLNVDNRSRKKETENRPLDLAIQVLLERVGFYGEWAFLECVLKSMGEGRIGGRNFKTVEEWNSKEELGNKAEPKADMSAKNYIFKMGRITQCLCTDGKDLEMMIQNRKGENE